MVNIIEFLRKKTIEDLWKLSSLHGITSDTPDGGRVVKNEWVPPAWPTWKQKICDLCPDTNSQQILDLGDNLRNIMDTTNPNSTTNPIQINISEMQSMKSASGALWESLVTWYCNLCLIGTRTVIIKKTSMVPEILIDTIEIDYDGDTSTAEADLWAITFPNNEEFIDDIPESFVDKYKITKKHPDGGATQNINQKTLGLSISIKKWLAKIIDENFSDFELGIISCKTPWNDFAVIPEHWDLVYDISINYPDALKSKKITIGINAEHPLSELKKFFYGFVTLPSQEPQKFSNPKTLPILRLKQLSGGNYWGLPTQTGVNSVKDIFTKNFSSSVGSKLEHQTLLQAELSKLNTVYDYFKL
tara:strand:+ start:1460 stop:2536 length:1077 start_codon:yes stop_codon:yes gene_type:complete